MNSSDATCPTSVPGLWHNGDCSLLCRPTKWYDILIFYFGNYLAHVATVTCPPGASVVDRVRNMLKALFFPLSGFALGLEAISSMAMLAPTPLQTAARAGALLMVVESRKSSAAATLDAQPHNEEDAQGGDSIELGGLEQNSAVQTVDLLQSKHRPWISTKIHGNYSLPEGYEFRRVPYYTRFENDEEEITIRRKAKDSAAKWYDVFDKFSERERTAQDIACSYNGAKAIVSIVQIVFGIFTLYRTKGNQIERFGYAAYGLTVTPYALMSVVNLAGNLLRPDYPARYIVKSKVLEDLQRVQARKIVSATIGQIDETSLDLKRHDERMNTLDILKILGYVPVIGIHLLVMGIMTKFANGDSTHAQRVWIICWLVFGVISLADTIRPDHYDRRPLKSPPRFQDIWRPRKGKDRRGTMKTTLNAQSEDHENSRGNSIIHKKQREDTFDGMGEPAMQRSMDWALLMYTAPAIGGFVVVAQMLQNYGVCAKMLDVNV